MIFAGFSLPLLEIRLAEWVISGGSTEAEFGVFPTEMWYKYEAKDMADSRFVKIS